MQEISTAFIYTIRIPCSYYEFKLKILFTQAEIFYLVASTVRQVRWIKFQDHHDDYHHHQWLYSRTEPWPQLIRFRNHSVRHTVGLPRRVISSP